MDLHVHIEFDVRVKNLAKLKFEHVLLVTEKNLLLKIAKIRTFIDNKYAVLLYINLRITY